MVAFYIKKDIWKIYLKNLKDLKEIWTTEPSLPDKNDKELFDLKSYRSAVGSLIYLAICTR